MEYIPPDGTGKSTTNLKNGRKKKHFSLLKISFLLLGDPNQFDDVALQNGGDNSWQVEANNDLAYKRQNKPRSTKPQDFQVSSSFFLFIGINFFL